MRIVEVPSTATAAHSQFAANAQSGSDDVDIYNLDVTWIAEFAANGWLRPLDRTRINEHAFLAKPLAAGRYDGELWALPFNTDVPLLYYRKDLLGDAPPATWQELRERIDDAWRQAQAEDRALPAGTRASSPTTKGSRSTSSRRSCATTPRRWQTGAG